MGDSVESKGLIKVSVAKLGVGMFVESIDNTKGQVSIANAGQIRSKEAIAKLLRSGITHVWVNAERSSPDCGLNKPVVKPTPVAKRVSTDRVNTQKKAKELMVEAKDLIQKVLSETFEGKAVEVEPFEALADNMIESVLLDADALKCVSALRSKDAYLLEHSINVAFLLVTFGRYLKFDTDMLKKLAVGFYTISARLKSIVRF